MKNLKDILNEAQEGMGIYLVCMGKEQYGDWKEAAITILPTRYIEENKVSYGYLPGIICVVKKESMDEVESTILTSNIIYFPDFKEQKWEPKNTRDYLLVKPTDRYLNQIIDRYASLGHMYTDISKTIKGYKRYL